MAGQGTGGQEREKWWGDEREEEEREAGRGGGGEFTERAEDFPLSRLGKPRPDPERVVGGERQRPAGTRIAFGHGQHHPPEDRQAELVAAEPARLQYPVEPGLGEPPVELWGVVPQPLRLVLLVADGRDQRPRPFDDRLRRQVRLRDRDVLRSHSAPRVP